MKEDLFASQHIEEWKSLENILKTLKKTKLKKIDNNQIENLLGLYNKVSGHLSYCRTHYPASSTTIYLNELVSSSHSFIYRSQTSNIKKILQFLLFGFPRALKENSLYVIISTLVFIVGLIGSYVYTVISPDNAIAFLPAEYVKSVDFKGQSSASWNNAIMSSFILTNNIKVGFFAFALGTTLGIGTVWLLFKNAFMLGGLGGLALYSGNNIRFWSLILPHGILELFAIFVCGAAGLVMGYSIIYPGINSRKDSFILGSRKAINLVLGTIPIFVIAGVIEGYFTPLPIAEVYKLGFALFTLILLAAYIVLPNIFSRKMDINNMN